MAMLDLILERFFKESPMILCVIVAGVLGFAIGFERKLRNKEAGIRTHTMVCIGAALMTVIGLYGFGPNADGARVAAQIVTGIGFLGAGIIVYRQNEVKGLTTAAGVWATAGVGMACGTQLYVLALGATAFIIVMQCLQHTNIPPFKQKRRYNISICFQKSEGNNLEIKEIFGIDRFNRLNIERKDGELWYTAMLSTERELPSGELDRIMREHPYIQSIERCDQA
jgi:uncharacterized membrane protein YhiD involved in acid resistance